MHGILTYMYHNKSTIHVGKHTVHWVSGVVKQFPQILGEKTMFNVLLRRYPSPKIQLVRHTHTIHVWYGIFTYIYHENRHENQLFM